MDKLLGAVCGAHDLFQVPTDRRFLWKLLNRDLRKTEDSTQDVVEIVSDPSRQTAQALQFPNLLDPAVGLAGIWSRPVLPCSRSTKAFDKGSSGRAEKNRGMRGKEILPLGVEIQDPQEPSVDAQCHRSPGPNATINNSRLELRLGAGESSRYDEQRNSSAELPGRPSLCPIRAARNRNS